MSACATAALKAGRSLAGIREAMVLLMKESGAAVAATGNSTMAETRAAAGAKSILMQDFQEERLNPAEIKLDTGADMLSQDPGLSLIHI